VENAGVVPRFPYDEAQKYYKGDRRALMAARWRLETEEDAIWFVQSRGVYKQRSGTKREREPSEKMTGRVALLSVLARHGGELPVSELFDVAEKMCACTRNSLAGIRSQLETDGLLTYVLSRGTYKLTRAGRQEVEDT
jgi:hypothetical protein